MNFRQLRRIGIAALALAAACGSLQAGSICNATTSLCDANWQPYITPIAHAQAPGPNGQSYFDGFSWDGPNANIAYFIEGQGEFQGDPLSPDARLPFWGNTDGSAVNSFYFQSNGQPQVANFLAFQGLWAPYSSVGWYDPHSSAWGWIREANGTLPVVPESFDFTPTADFGLFFVPDSLTFNPSTPAYYTNSSLNGIAAADVTYAADNNIPLGPETAQHFAVFSNNSGGYYVGINDRSSQVGDADYNDMIFTLNAVPEPGTFSLGAGMLSAILAAHRVMRRR